MAVVSQSKSLVSAVVFPVWADIGFPGNRNNPGTPRPLLSQAVFSAVDPGQADRCLPVLRRKRVPGSSDCRPGCCRLLLRALASKRRSGPRGLASAGPWAVECNSSTRQTFPPRNTLARKRGVTQSLSAVRTTPTGVAGLPVTARTNARPRSGSRLPDTTVRILR